MLSKLVPAVSPMRRISTMTAPAWATKLPDNPPIYPYPVSLYNEVVQKVRSFCLSQNYIEAHNSVTHPKQEVRLRACEDPETMVGAVWGEGTSDQRTLPLDQSNQMIFEWALLEALDKDPETKGFFAATTSYRDEQNPDPGRHLRSFPMVEIEGAGNFDDLLDFQSKLLVAAGFEAPVVVDYRDFAKFRGVKYLSNTDEKALRVVAPVVQLINFPYGEDVHGDSWPFFNMRVREDHEGLYAQKCDVIIDGVEVFGSAERDSRPDVMRDQFYRSVNGRYCQMLFHKFGKENIERELESYFKLFHDEESQRRFGMGIGFSRFIAAYAARYKKWGDSPTTHGNWVYVPKTNEWLYEAKRLYDYVRTIPV